MQTKDSLPHSQVPPTVWLGCELEFWGIGFLSCLPKRIQTVSGVNPTSISSGSAFLPSANQLTKTCSWPLLPIQCRDLIWVDPYRHSLTRLRGAGKDLVIVWRLQCRCAVCEYVNCLCDQAASEIVRRGKSKHFKVFCTVTAVGGIVYVFCVPLDPEARVGFSVSCQPLLLDLKQKWGLSTNIGRTSQRAANWKSLQLVTGVVYTEMNGGKLLR